MTNPNDAESLPNSLPELEDLVAQYITQMQLCDATYKDLLHREDPANGVFFAAEIHENRQEKNQLEVQKQFAEVRLNRLRMEADF